MARTVAIGIQDFGKIIENDCFYVDKTHFIKEWWENRDDVTLIARPRRFGKTLTMSMLEHFFSVKYAGQGENFKELSIWKEEDYRKLQGTYPVINLSFASVKEADYETTVYRICQILSEQYTQNYFLTDSDVLTDGEKTYFRRMASSIEKKEASMAIYRLSDYMSRYYGKKVIILLDEYDTPMQEAYIGGFWDELSAFSRSLFNATFKTNPYMERAIMTGITRVSKESIFSDLNNLKVVTATSDEYATSFGFTEAEVFAAMDEFDMGQKAEVKRWYDGFTFGKVKDIYNPWSIINYLDTGKLSTYWANTSGNSLVGKLLREGNRHMKEQFEVLLRGQSIKSRLDEQVVYNQLDEDESAVWSLLLASGYLKVVDVEGYEDWKGVESKHPEYELALTNLEVQIMFGNMISGWFGKASADYNDFVKALLLGDIKAMNAYMNRIALSVFSYFDTGKSQTGAEPERFYHGFVLGLLVELSERYVLTSNRESGFGRYDVMLEPLDKSEDGIIIEFKVYDSDDEAGLRDTVQSALSQIENKKYEQILVDHGIVRENIRKYGFAFEGKKVLIGE